MTATHELVLLGIGFVFGVIVCGSFLWFVVWPRDDEPARPADDELGAEFATLAEDWQPNEQWSRWACTCGEINARHCPVHNDPPDPDGVGTGASASAGLDADPVTTGPGV